MNAPGDDMLDVATLARMLAGSWRPLLLSLVLGVAGGGVAQLLIPPQWEARATVLAARRAEAPALDAVAGAAAAGAASSFLGGALSSKVETDLALLRSQRLLREVSESIPITARLRSPRVPLASVVQSFTPTGVFRPVKLRGVRRGNGWQLQGDGVDISVEAARPVELPIGQLTIAVSAPDQFDLTLYDVPSTLERAAKRIAVRRDGGDVLTVAARWEDSVTGAAVANVLVDRYLAWQKGVDAGDNVARQRFLEVQADSTRSQLERALAALREYQERSGLVDPEVSGTSLLELSAEVNEKLRALVLEETALTSLLDRLQEDSASVRALTGFPSFVRSQALNDLLTEIMKLESERATLLATRTSDDPNVKGRTDAIRVLESQLLPIAKTYARSIAQDRNAMAQAADSITKRMAALPSVGEEFFLRTREVKRLSELALILDAKVVQARLATIAEGGSARRIDEAMVTRKPVRPRPFVTLGLGAVVGMIVGLVLVLFASPPRPQRSNV